jgi:hypothetical protein
MKRCPQCEFIYEDDQSCCDMDGIDLVFAHSTHSQPSPKPAVPAKRNSSRRSLLSFCGVVLGVLVCAIGFASLERAVTVSSEPAPPAQPSVNQPAPEEESAPRPVKAPEDEVAVDPTVTMVSNTAKATRLATREPAHEPAAKPAAEPLQRNSIGTRGVILGELPRQNRIDSARPQSEMIRPTSAAPPAKKDSKVVSIVKKTGRFLKKPFRL